MVVFFLSTWLEIASDEVGAWRVWVPLSLTGGMVLHSCVISATENSNDTHERPDLVVHSIHFSRSVFLSTICCAALAENSPTAM